MIVVCDYDKDDHNDNYNDSDDGTCGRVHLVVIVVSGHMR